MAKQELNRSAEVIIYLLIIIFSVIIFGVISYNLYLRINYYSNLGLAGIFAQNMKSTVDFVIRIILVFFLLFFAIMVGKFGKKFYKILKNKEKREI